MINSKKIQFIIILLLTCIALPVFTSELNEPNEPNTPATELKFEISNSPARWLIGNDQGKGPVMPEFMAEFYIKNSNNIPIQNQYGKLESLLQTNTGKTLSPEQKLFLETSSSYESRSQPNSSTPIDYKRIHLYSISRDDAEKMAKAFIENINHNFQNNLKNAEDYILKTEQTLSQYEKELQGKETELKKIEDEYKRIKEEIHQFSTDEEAVELAKRSIIEIDKTLNDLSIDLAGIRERIRTIEKYRDTSHGVEINDKLTSMYIDLMIELSGLEARMRATEKIYTREKEFLNLFNEQMSMTRNVVSLRSRIADSQKSIESSKDYMIRNSLPAEIYLNTVKIYPVID